MGIFRYIVQGIGWEVGRTAAREGIDALREQRDGTQREEPVLSKRELARLEKARAKQEARERKEREAAAARAQAKIDNELSELKKKAGR
jgi:hypothetical protein